MATMVKNQHDTRQRSVSYCTPYRANHTGTSKSVIFGPLLTIFSVVEVVSSAIVELGSGLVWSILLHFQLEKHLSSCENDVNFRFLLYIYLCYSLIPKSHGRSSCGRCFCCERFSETLETINRGNFSQRMKHITTQILLGKMLTSGCLKKCRIAKY